MGNSFQADQWFMNQSEEFRRILNRMVNAIYILPENKEDRATIQNRLIEAARTATRDNCA